MGGALGSHHPLATEGRGLRAGSGRGVADERRAPGAEGSFGGWRPAAAERCAQVSERRAPLLSYRCFLFLF